MAPIAKQITFRQIERPRGRGAEENLEWLFNSLGIGEGRDVDQVARRILAALLYYQSAGEGASVEKISRDLNISSSRVNHHIRNLVNAGVVYRHKKRIYLRGHSLQSLVQELRKDALRVIEDIEAAAAEIDRSFGLDK
ncbi:winged helix-turn-helix domain-containing protein [Methanoculleus sp.]|uniref:winged helix-turn-helix domain-containing protein n=1 Tax=Methanoculleus sp. TaxID=90427 RepID=UPI002633C2EF|nr:winged helix-turn-helix domain-containing protein [Methanoculleus sp.]MDI6866309.1 winged helix-turn-helix domain-containing protein [Methanoculleus sp.]